MSAPVSEPVPAAGAVCAVCGHDGASHHSADIACGVRHDGGTACWAPLPVERRADGTAGPAALCDCRAFVPEELEQLRARVAELEAALLLANTRLGDVEMLAEHAAGKGNDFIDTVEVLDALGLDADGNPLPSDVPVQALREPEPVLCASVRDVLPCVLAEDHDGDVHRDVNGYEWPTAPSLKGRALLDALTVERAEAAHRRRLGVEDPHDSPLHHPYRLGRDLPEGGA